MAGGEKSDPPEIVRNIRLAQAINSIIGMALFHPWNIGQIPQDDLEDIDALARYRAKFAEVRKNHG